MLCAGMSACQLRLSGVDTDVGVSAPLPLLLMPSLALSHEARRTRDGVSARGTLIGRDASGPPTLRLAVFGDGGGVGH